MAQMPVYTVSQINGYLKDLMEADPLLQSLLIRGEISNYKRYPSGHHYFSLKDDKGSMRCVLFRGDAARLRFQPADGMSVLAFGRISVFPRDGQYQLYCTQLMEDGRGALDLAFERLRRQLEEEGLFAPDRKKPLPGWPGRIALVTSPAGAAVRDMIRILGARWPMAGVLVVP
ncbi:MAG TPA: exodeoxyribonuclease VII large subunit, partial [Candidatus Enterenecus stercoripullorum]|nr:exodeoxyribonuclease VII large subunit [Candidatus Enterenecus stercoripullorum]